MSRIPLVAALALAILACDRNLEPYDPDEQPREPDLSKIFPEGAERAARLEPGLPPAPGRGAPPLAQEAEGAGMPVSGTVRLSEDLGAPVPPGAVLFIIARRGGGGPPLAVKRIPAPRFPLDFALGPDDRMIEAMPFTGPLRITARVDADGDAASRAQGDLQGAAAGSFQPGAAGIEVVIDEVL